MAEVQYDSGGYTYEEPTAEPSPSESAATSGAMAGGEVGSSWESFTKSPQQQQAGYFSRTAPSQEVAAALYQSYAFPQPPTGYSETPEGTYRPTTALYQESGGDTFVGGTTPTPTGGSAEFDPWTRFADLLAEIQAPAIPVPSPMQATVAYAEGNQKMLIALFVIALAVGVGYWWYTTQRKGKVTTQ